jgi:hypothetical protein
LIEIVWRPRNTRPGAVLFGRAQREHSRAQQFLTQKSGFRFRAEIYLLAGVDMNQFVGDYGFVVNEQVDF